MENTISKQIEEIYSLANAKYEAIINYMMARAEMAEDRITLSDSYTNDTQLMSRLKNDGFNLKWNDDGTVDILFKIPHHI